jgi:mono/diheme cytochrome c family protein
VIILFLFCHFFLTTLLVAAFAWDTIYSSLAQRRLADHDVRRDSVRSKNVVAGIVAAFTIMTALATLDRAWADDTQTTPIDYTKTSPADLVKSTPKGKLVNPYKDTQADITEQGAKLLQSYSCSGCHGGGGGGGICPPLTNDTWVYGGDDDTLFRLVTLGSDELQKNGYSRVGHENVVAPMPPMGGVVKSADDLWKLLTFVRSKYSGDPAYKFGAPPETD